MIGVKVRIVPLPLNKVIRGSVIVGHSGNTGLSDQDWLRIWIHVHGGKSGLMGRVLNLWSL